ncbi:hypothetical protein OG21DRAFT_1509264 [Imleria badia]|nr:hypothetical protein OG21DRAFT_1509264 [Imleria badia]
MLYQVRLSSLASLLKLGYVLRHFPLRQAKPQPMPNHRCTWQFDDELDIACLL